MPSIPVAVLEPDYPASGVETINQDAAGTTSQALSTGDCRMVVFRPRRDTPVGNVVAEPGLTVFNIGAGAVSKFKFGVWQVALDATSKIASITPLLQTADQSANVATLFGTPFLETDVPFVAANGLAASVVLAAGQTYAAGWLIVTTGTITQQPTLYAGTCLAAASLGTKGRKPKACRLTGLTDLPIVATAVGSLAISGVRIYAQLKA